MTTKVSLAIHPGEHIADELEARDMTAADLAHAMGAERVPSAVTPAAISCDTTEGGAALD
jgi:plasmid maintenance system antidote protein VapI